MRDTTTSGNEGDCHNLIWRNGKYFGTKNITIDIESESRKVRNRKIKKILGETI